MTTRKPPDRPVLKNDRRGDKAGRRVNDYRTTFLFEDRRKADPKGRRNLYPEKRIDVV